MTTPTTMRNTKAQMYAELESLRSALVAEREVTASYRALAKSGARTVEAERRPHATHAVFGGATIAVFDAAVEAVKYAHEQEMHHPQTTYVVRSGKFTLSATSKSVSSPAGTHTELVYQTQH